MGAQTHSDVWDFVVIGSGFGGSVSAMRLVEKGYRVLVLERGKRYRDQDYAKTNLQVWKYLWAPTLRCFGILQISPFKDVFVLHGSGVGGGSLGYACVLMEPDAEAFKEAAWRKPVDWKSLLAPHYQTARRMLGVDRNPRLWRADHVLQGIAGEMGQGGTFHATDVGIFFGKGYQEGQVIPDPFFGGEGPDRTACTHCGGCMVGCRYDSKNTLVKNYLYLAEKWGAQVWAEEEVSDIRPLPAGQADGARYEIVTRRSTAWFVKPERTVRARSVVLSAGALGTMRLLFRCREITGSLPAVSPRLGTMVRTNSEALLGATSRDDAVDFSKGIAITSIFHADATTTVEPVRYPVGSDLMRILAGPLVFSGTLLSRFFKSLWEILRHPVDFLRVAVLPGWAKRSTILLVMQTHDNRVRMRLARSLFTLFRRNLVSEPDQEHPIPTQIEIGHQVTRDFAAGVQGMPLGSINESLLNIPITAHILGGCPVGRDATEGVVGLDFQVHNYPGIYVVDGSVVPANPGVNPSLTITAIAEYALSLVPPRPGAAQRPPMGVDRPQPAPQAAPAQLGD
jgi:cholesterol oxidase